MPRLSLTSREPTWAFTFISERSAPMAEHSLIIPEKERVPAVQGPGYSPTLRDIVAIGFRRRRLIALSFFGIMMGAGMAALFLEAYFVVNGYFACVARREPNQR